MVVASKKKRYDDSDDDSDDSDNIRIPKSLLLKLQMSKNVLK